MDWGRDLPGWQMGTGSSPHALSSISDPGALTDYPFRTGLAHFKPTLSLDSSQTLIGRRWRLLLKHCSVQSTARNTEADGPGIRARGLGHL